MGLLYQYTRIFSFFLNHGFIIPVYQNILFCLKSWVYYTSIPEYYLLFDTGGLLYRYTGKKICKSVLESLIIEDNRLDHLYMLECMAKNQDHNNTLG